MYKKIIAVITAMALVTSAPVCTAFAADDSAEQCSPTTKPAASVPLETTASDIDLDQLTENLTMLSTDQMTVTIDQNFPRVVKYEMNGNTLYGQPLPLDTIEIAADGYVPSQEAIDMGVTGVPLKPTVSCITAGQKATYTLTVQDAAAGIDAVITAELKAEGNTVSFDITNVENKMPDSKINTIHIPNFSLVSVRSNESGAEFSGAVMKTEPTVSGDSTIEIDDRFTPASPNYKTAGYMYGFVSNSNFSAGVWSNSEAPEEQRILRYSQSASGGAVHFTGLGSNVWTYWQNDMPAPQVEYPSRDTEAYPSVKVAIAAGDQNQDGVMNWQDGAIVFRSIMNNPYKCEEVPELVNQRIVENFGSQAAHPFAETLDGVKRVFLATDGLGQMVLLKGYASEGLDSGDPDYGDIGQRIGGTEDMSFLLEKGESYGARFGVHINSSEIYPEAESFNEDIILSKDGFGSGGLDDAYFINDIYDLASGERAKRLDDLYNKLGSAGNKLDFIYLDAWDKPSWNTSRISNQLKERSWRCANEWSSVNESDSTWSYWATDQARNTSENNGINSEIARFLRNHQKDTWIGNNSSLSGAAAQPLLGGMDVVGFEGWQGENDFDTYIARTFGTNLPTKFLQHFLITNWEDDPTIDPKVMNAEKEIRLQRVNGDGTVDKVTVSRNEKGRGRTITFNGFSVLTSSAENKEAYLLPWYWDSEGKEVAAEDQKLYHYNAAGGTSTWALPSEFESGVEVYALSDTGKSKVSITSIFGNQITLTAQSGVPYVIYKADHAPVNPSFADMNWGEGTHLVDPNFTGQSLTDAWTVRGDDVSIIKKHGNPVLNMENSSGEASVSQTLTGLTGGRRYAVLVGVDNQSPDAKAILEVKTGDATLSNYAGPSFVRNAVRVNSHHHTAMQNLYVFFTVPEGQTTAAVTLRREAGEGVAQFDELRVVETQQNNQIDEKTFTQDFENNVQGLYPFVPTFYSGDAEDSKIHLSKKHAPYTQRSWKNSYQARMIDDVISGDWSLKINQLINYDCPVIQTIPEMYRFKPNTKYTVSFDYEMGVDNAYAFAVGEGAYDYMVGGSTAVELENFSGTAVTGAPKRFTKTFTTGNTENTWIGIYSNPNTASIETDFNKDSKEASMWNLGYASFVLDNLTITEGGVPDPVEPSSPSGGRSHTASVPKDSYTIAGNKISQTISSSDLKTLADSGKSLVLRCDQAGMTLEPAALKAILAAVPTTVSSITLTAAPAELSPNSEASDRIGTRPAYDFTIRYQDSKGNPVTVKVDFPGGSAAITLNYTLAEGETTKQLSLVYVDKSGALTRLDQTHYADGKLSADVPHFSIYGVAYQASFSAPVFTDIENHWAKDDIEFVTKRGLLAGTGNSLFSPDTPMTRGMFVTVLGKLTAIDPSNYKTSRFSDVKADAYYAPAVEWAAQNNIVRGLDDKRFGPNKPVTREEMAVILTNYARQLGYPIPAPIAAATFTDNDQISVWAAKEVTAMQRAGVFQGRTGGYFDPQASATRAEVLAVLRQFVEIVIDPGLMN